MRTNNSLVRGQKSFQLNGVAITLMVLMALYICIDFASILLSHKQVMVFGFVAIGSSMVYPLTYGINDITTEVFGYSTGRMIIWIGIFMDVIYISTTHFVVSLPSPHHWALGQEYKDIVYPFARTIISGTVGVFAGRFLNIFIISKLKIFLKGRLFWLRSLISTATGISFHSIITDTLIFIGIISVNKIISIIILNILFNCLFTVVFLYFVNFSATRLKLVLGIDTYDSRTRFNPFRLKG